MKNSKQRKFLDLKPFFTFKYAKQDLRSCGRMILFPLTHLSLPTSCEPTKMYFSAGMICHCVFLLFNCIYNSNCRVNTFSKRQKVETTTCLNQPLLDDTYELVVNWQWRENQDKIVMIFLRSSNGDLGVDQDHDIQGQLKVEAIF